MGFVHPRWQMVRLGCHFPPRVYKTPWTPSQRATIVYWLQPFIWDVHLFLQIVANPSSLSLPSSFLLICELLISPVVLGSNNLSAKSILKIVWMIPVTFSLLKCLVLVWVELMDYQMTWCNQTRNCLSEISLWRNKPKQTNSGEIFWHICKLVKLKNVSYFILANFLLINSVKKGLKLRLIENVPTLKTLISVFKDSGHY